MKNEEDKRQALNFIQGIIHRVENNTFQIKGFTIALSTILGGLYAENQNNNLLFMILGISVICPLVDAHYLQLGRKYRELYTESVKKIEEDRSISEIYSMSIKNIDNCYCHYLRCLFSKSMIMPYVLILVIGMILLLLQPIQHCL